jgi:hypothetical protein
MRTYLPSRHVYSASGVRSETQVRVKGHSAVRGPCLTKSQTTRQQFRLNSELILQNLRHGKGANVEIPTDRLNRRTPQSGCPSLRPAYQVSARAREPEGLSTIILPSGSSLETGGLHDSSFPWSWRTFKFWDIIKAQLPRTLQLPLN